MESTSAAGMNIVTWIPEDLHPFLLGFKGLLAAASVVLLITHMQIEWRYLTSRAQRLRYLTLLGYAVLVAGATGEQLAEGMLLSYRHLGSIVVTALLCWTSYVSMREAHERRVQSR